MAEPTPALQITQRDDVTVVELTERKILDEININQIGEQLYSLVTRQAEPKLILDFSNVSHMSSSALGMLITLLKRVREKEGQLRLCNIQPAILEVFRITRLDGIFQINENRQDAMASLH